MKKAFSCGHKGLGKFCHRCAQADALVAEAQALTKAALADKKNADTKAVLEKTTQLETRAQQLRQVPQKQSTVVPLIQPVPA